MILCSNPRAQFLSHRKEIEAAIARVLERGIYIRGEECSSFEREFAAYLGIDYALGVANGTEAIWVALVALGVGPGDEVITVSHTAVATIAAIELAGATPVFADIDPISFTLSPASAERAVTPKTKAVIAVHLYGNPCEMDTLMALCQRHNLKLVEDCAQSHGASYRGKILGTLGDISCFSFYPTKNLGAIGDGGAICTSSQVLAEKCALIREYGWKERFISEIAGGNSRLDELQAAILRVKLPHLDADNNRRRAIAELYRQGLEGLGFALPVERPDCRHVYHLFVLRTSSRNALRDALQTAGIVAGVHYPVPVHQQPAYLRRVHLTVPLLETERAAGEVLTLPVYPELSAGEVAEVIHAARGHLVEKQAA